MAERDWEAVFDLAPVAASHVRNALADEVADRPTWWSAVTSRGWRFGRVITASGNRTFRAI